MNLEVWRLVFFSLLLDEANQLQTLIDFADFFEGEILDFSPEVEDFKNER